ncbi:MAG TPA: helicase-related protein [Caldilinea sp.]|nr:helicase-related protein [Caldilinea sp.]
MSYAVGSLVKARGREWVVLPESNEDLLVLRPLGGTEREVAGIYLPLEGDAVEPAAFDLPDPAQPGDYLSCRLLRDAVRLSFRAGAGPFRSAARIAVEPRPYQLVPLLMALKLDPVRMLIADDVGVGKTVEACLIARELFDRGEIRRMAVLCPPHLAEQWQTELREKFHIDAELVLPSTVTRLERNTAAGQSLFDLYPFVVVSTEFIKSSRYRDEFIRTCPEFVIVDEAHTCAFSHDQRSGRHLRHQLLEGLAADPDRHLVLVTATPHSGDEGAFRSLLTLLRRDFENLPENLAGQANERRRRDVAAHLVQRRRADVRAFMDADTPFPAREERDAAYTLSDEYRRLFEAALRYARERVTDASGGKREQRIRWWSVLALLRSLASSPAAAAATLRARSVTVEAATADEVNVAGERSVLDLDDVDADEYLDVTPGSQEDDDSGGSERDRLLALARRADALKGPAYDAKLKRATELIAELIKDGFHPILFCRFIATAEYVAEELRKALPRTVEVAAVTGQLPPAEREVRVAQLGEFPRRVLVATDCLSEGVNLQDHFNAVMHYDLSWNPTRHEQREGRVDRYGQPSPTVRTLTYYGVDNQIDGVVLEVLLRKHRTIRNSLGISVPVPATTNEVVQTLMQGMMLRGDRISGGGQLSFLDVDSEFGGAQLAAFNTQWDNATEKEKLSRTLFAQATLDAREVAEEWAAMRSAIGVGVDVEEFVINAVRLHDGTALPDQATGGVTLMLPGGVLREVAGGEATIAARFELPVPDAVSYLSRTHPFVEGLASYVVDTALDPLLGGRARRSGAMRTRAVTKRTTLLLLRLRHHLITRRGSEEDQMLAEECMLAAFEGAPEAAFWLSQDEAEMLLRAEPAGNIAPQQATNFVGQVTAGIGHIRTHIDQLAVERAEELLEAHRRVRIASRQTGLRYDVRAQLPVDVLGIFVLLPQFP